MLLTKVIFKLAEHFSRGEMLQGLKILEGQLLVREGFEREIEVVKLLHSATNSELLLSKVKQNLSKIAENQIIEIDNKKFDCPVKYLEHEISHPAHKYSAWTKAARSLLREVVGGLAKLECQI